MIVGFVHGQTLRINASGVVADTINYLTARFTFQTSDWDGLEVWAHFAKGEDTYDIRLDDGQITQDMRLNLSAGKWRLYLHGNRYDGGIVVQRVTTEVKTFDVTPTGILDGEPFPTVPPSAGEQIIASAQLAEAGAKEAAEAAQESAKDAKEAAGKIGTTLDEVEASKNQAVQTIENAGEAQTKTIRDEGAAQLSGLKTAVEGHKSEAAASAQAAKSAADAAEQAKNQTESAASGALTDIKQAAQNAKTDINTARESAVGAVQSAGNAGLTEISGAVSGAKTDIQTAAETELTDIGNAGMEEVRKVQAAGETAVGNVAAVRDAVVRDVQDAGSDAIDAIETAGQTKLDEIAAEKFGAVRYDIAQELTDVQRGQARTNMGAAAQTEVDSLSEAIALTNSDVEYIQNPNLYDGEWTVGRYIYDTGKIYSGTSTHCRNVNPVPLDQNKEYNVAVKAEFVNKTMSVYIYDSNKVFIKRVTTKDIVHISGASFVNFAIEQYSTDFPGEPLHVMVWESDSTVSYAEWLEYGEKGSYIKNKQIIPDTAIEKAMLARDKARFDDSFNYVAYSSVNGSDGAINTAEHFKWACKQGFTGIKGDVRPTSDGVLIMCHDAGFTLTDSGTITTYNADTATPIHDMTAEQCLTLQHRNGNYVCSFDEYIKICKKYGKIAYITIRDEYIDEVVAAMFPILDKYNMRTRCIVNSSTLASLRVVRAEDNNIMLSQVLGSGSAITEAAINQAISLGNCMICGFDFPNFGEFDDITDSVVAYAKENDIRLYEAQINNMEKVEQLMEYGISGAQMTVVPAFD